MEAHFPLSSENGESASIMRSDMVRKYFFEIEKISKNFDFDLKNEVLRY